MYLLSLLLQFAPSSSPSSFNPHLTLGVSEYHKTKKIQEHEDLKQNNPGVEYCANCLKQGHVLADCVWDYSLTNGDMYGCPVCNTIGHHFDNCPEAEKMDKYGKFEFLVVRRGGKCMIRSNFPVYTTTTALLNEREIPDGFVMPWSRENVIKVGMNKQWVQKIEAYDYSEPRKPISEDDSLTPDSIKNMGDGSYSTFKEMRNANSQSGVARGISPAVKLAAVQARKARRNAQDAQGGMDVDDQQDASANTAGARPVEIFLTCLLFHVSRFFHLHLPSSSSIFIFHLHLPSSRASEIRHPAVMLLPTPTEPISKPCKARSQMRRSWSRSGMAKSRSSMSQAMPVWLVGLVTVA
ncbi:hypothetical protein F4819DRAFT_147595 [Hypoxylon fuscum]|nr:hypothetical protein F4819DRAFT_147595 [Hypoxylon fuscum]